LLVRFGGKLVLEVLPAALASAIGAFLFAQYQFDRGAAAGHAVTPAVAVPASAEMLQLVRDEHAMIHDFLTAQRAAEQNRAVAADAADAQAADATAPANVTAVPQRAELPSAAKAAVRHNRAIAAATGATESATAALPRITISGAGPAPAVAPVVVASTPPDATALVAGPISVSATAQPLAGLLPAPLPPAHPSIVAATLAVPGHVVSVTLHAVMAIGGIPSWLGHRFGDDDVGAVALPSSSAS
jgi:hypothetical protein